MRLPGHLNAALCGDLERRLGTESLLNWLEDEAARVSALGTTHTGAVGFTERLLSDRRIVRLLRKPYLPSLASIRTSVAGYEIFYRPIQRIEHQRFWIAHEIAHTFWFSQERLGSPLSPLQSALGPDDTIEWLCNRAAAALLLPKSDLKKHAFDATYLHVIPKLAKTHLISERLVARRLIQDIFQADIAVICVSPPDESHSSARVSWATSARLPGTERREPRGRFIPPELLPDLDEESTTRCELDGRWWTLIEPSRDGRAPVPLGRLKSQPVRSGLAAYSSGRWYVGLPSTGSEPAETS
jgi:IrrE N-terminal-like domain